jgi:hypothetical protein
MRENRLRWFRHVIKINVEGQREKITLKKKLLDKIENDMRAISVSISIVWRYRKSRRVEI